MALAGVGRGAGVVLVLAGLVGGCTGNTTGDGDTSGSTSSSGGGSSGAVSLGSSGSSAQVSSGVSASASGGRSSSAGGSSGGVTSRGSSSVGGASTSVGGASTSVGGASTSVGGASTSVGGASTSVGGASSSVGGSSGSATGIAFVAPLDGAPVGFSMAVSLAVQGSPTQVTLQVGSAAPVTLGSPYQTTVDLTGQPAGAITLNATAAYGASMVNATPVTVTLVTTSPGLLSVVPAEGPQGPARGASVWLSISDVLGPNAAGAFTMRVNGGPAITTPAVVAREATYTNVHVPVPDVVAGDTLTLTVDPALAANTVGNPYVGQTVFTWTTPRFSTFGTSYGFGVPPVAVAGFDAVGLLLSFPGQLSVYSNARRLEESFSGGVLTGANPPIAMGGAYAGPQDLVMAWLETSGMEVALKVRRQTPVQTSPELASVLLPAGTNVAPLVAAAGGEAWVVTTSAVSGADRLDMLHITPGGNTQAPPFDLSWPTLGARALTVQDGVAYVAVPDVVAGLTRVVRWNADNTWSLEPDLPEAWELSLAATTVNGPLELYAVLAQQTYLGTHLVVMRSVDHGAWTRVSAPLEVDVLNDVRYPRAVMHSNGLLTVGFVEEAVPTALQPGGFMVRALQRRNNRWESMSAQSPLPQRPSGFTLGVDQYLVPHLHLSFTGQPQDTVFVRLNGDLMAPTPSRPVTTTCSIPDPPPALLSQTGCFENTPQRVPAAGVVPFTINTTLYSDGAEKNRWVVVPPGQTIGVAADGTLSMPDGTITIKDFMVPLETTPGGQAVMAETRFMVKRDATTWQGYSYEWRADGTEADLLPGPTDPVPMTTEKLRDFTRNDNTLHTHTYPTRTQCLTCHNTAAGFVLGPQHAQWDRLTDQGNIHGPQLQLLAAAGYLSGTATNPLPPVPSPWDVGLGRETGVRAYLHANCAHCHRPGGIAGFMDLRFETPLASTNLCAVQRVVPGSPATSKLHIRMAATPGNGAPMPPLARRTVDTRALNLVDGWIASMTSCP